MTVTLRLSDQEMDLVRRYADMKGTTVSDVMRRAIMEMIEDEYDLTAYEASFAAYQTDPLTYTQDEMEGMLAE